jgi:hypothetical protein
MGLSTSGKNSFEIALIAANTRTKPAIGIIAFLTSNDRLP